ncbi:uncharacterized protein PITG_20694 [Phytophthora infestans T30-4]|uniref:RNase H type-1 domain-containing protein n=1 Tax=Phytophthora infestans (strain T30-4) TaxID=403677 RepID=D0P2T5_PHYIT|nr:uncharacterized protein PITG_20694 [Phytophthora infestans T30-4]EEY57070.1 conserved hypothetical protein [Phytophthora infestans T30-4]|eukprot:XP_002895397.1 conserved hypothetical protein [Phytophthora infestans T30-4]
MTRTWLTLGIKSSAIEHAIFSMKLLLMPAGVWRAADKIQGSDEVPAILQPGGRGGSRGNPGPGGSAVVIRTADATVRAQVCWIGTMSYANPRFTNSMGEHLGLFCGLKACDKHTFEPLHVIGGSAMIIRQLKQRKPLKTKHLQNYYWQSRKLADRLDVVAWHHHLREFSKMVDTFANMAMDNTSSTQGLLSEDTTATVRWAKSA